MTLMEVLARPLLLARVRPAWWRTADRVAAVAYGLPTAMLLAKHADGVTAIAGAVTGAVVVAWPIAGRRRYPLGAFALAVTAVAAPDFRHLGAAALFGPLYVTVWTIGYAAGMHRRYTDQLVRGQAELTRAQVDQARRELIEQRITIAREVHDVVAHHMSVITVQAGYGGLLLDEAADARAATRARDALAVIETTGRQALDEMRRLVGVLRAEDDAEARADSRPGHQASAADLHPAPGLGDLPRLLDQAAHAGIQAELITTGLARTLPPGEDLAAYRIVQEGLTNVIKHSGAVAARVHLDYGEDQLTIDIADEGPGSGRRPAAGGTHHGRGLSGMRERARLYGGSLRAAPTGAGGFQVTAQLPLAVRSTPAGATEPGGLAAR